MESAKMIEDKLDEMSREDEAADLLERRTRSQAGKEQHRTAPSVHKDGYDGFLRDPNVAPSKGRPEGSKRQKTFMEVLFSKHQITCSHCGSHDHNFATCPNKHLDKSTFPTRTAKKKNAPGNKKNI